jgi:hypothetical protein
MRLDDNLPASFIALLILGPLPRCYFVEGPPLRLHSDVGGPR